MTFGQLSSWLLENLHSEETLFTELFGDKREVRYYYRYTTLPSAEVHFLRFSILFTFGEEVEFRFGGKGKTVIKGLVKDVKDLPISKFILRDKI
jgi:hypothetical protein